MKTEINQIINISPEREKELLRYLDNYARMPGADVLDGLRKAIADKIFKNDDELIFLSFMFGSVNGILDVLQIQALLKHTDLGPEDVHKLIKKVKKDMDDALE
jgi:hypothetical protein